MADKPIELKETIEFITPHNHRVVIRGYSTGRIKQAVQRAYLEGSTVEATGNIDDKGKPISKVTSTGAAGLQATNNALEGMVLSLDDSSEDILNRILDLPEDDYSMVKAEVDKVTSPLAKKSDNASQTATTTP